MSIIQTITRCLAVYSVVNCVVGTIGNMFTIFIVLRTSLKETTTFIFLAFLAFTDMASLYFCKRMKKLSMLSLLKGVKLFFLKFFWTGWYEINARNFIVQPFIITCNRILNFLFSLMKYNLIVLISNFQLSLSFWN